jgi:coronin-1B/1C/6
MMAHSVCIWLARGKPFVPQVLDNVKYLTKPSDGNIRYFEYENDKFEYLSEYKSSDPQRGIGFMPKRGVNMHENEVVRAFKTVNDSYIEPISFIVPRRAEVFQDDIYPPTAGLKPAMSSGEWFSGKDGLPPKIDMFSLYVGEGLKEVPKETPSVVEKAYNATEAESVKEPEVKPLRSSSAAPPPSVKEPSASMAAIASKYADDDDDKKEDVDDSSSFEEVSKPTERPAAITLSPVEIEPPAISPPGLWKAKKTETKPTDTRADQVAFASFRLSELSPCCDIIDNADFPLLSDC